LLARVLEVDGKAAVYGLNRAGEKTTESEEA
jgi:hypothetical protein